jgi:glutathione S-transferase
MIFSENRFPLFRIMLWRPKMLKVWGRRSSFNVQKVMWLIGELGLQHQHIDAGGSFGGLDAPDFLAMNPHGRIPVIADDDAIAWESHAILRYLAARHGAGIFWSDDPVARARVDGWMDWSQTSLQPDFLIGVFWGFFRTPEDKRNWPAIRAALARCASDFGKLDRLLEDRAFLLGDALTLADITAGTSLYRYFELEIDRPQLKQVERWYRTLQQRAAFRDHVMIPFEELRGRLLDR